MSRRFKVVRVFSDIFSTGRIVVSLVSVKAAFENALKGLYLSVKLIGYRVLKIMLLDDRLLHSARNKTGCYCNYHTDHNNDNR
jgi:hypothetical protein